MNPLAINFTHNPLPPNISGITSQPAQAAYHYDDLPDSILFRTCKSVIILLFIVLGIVLNLVLIIAVYKEAKFHRPTFFFLLNLSFAELVRSALCLPFYFVALLNSGNFTGEDQFCKTASFFYSLLAYETIFTLLSLSLARYSVIAHQNFHRKKLTKFVCFTVIAMTWTLAVIMAIPPIFRAGIPRNAPAPMDPASQSPEQGLQEPKPYSGHLGPCSLSDKYYDSADTLGFIIVLTIVLIGIHLVYLRIFVFMRQHRKMNPTRRAPAISDNWTFFGPGAMPVLPAAVSSNFQSAIVQGVTNLGNNGRPTVGMPDTSRETLDNYHMEEKITKTAYFLTATITLLWCPYIVTTYIEVFKSQPTSESISFLSIFLTFFQSAVTPVTCIVMMPPVVDLACDFFKMIKCRKRARKDRDTNTTRLYENLTDLTCSSV